MTSFDEHLEYAEPHVRPILQELRQRILALDPKKIQEGITEQKRIRYSVNRIFAEVKVQKKLVLIRFFDMGLSDPEKLVRHIPYAASQGWQHDKEIRIDSMNLVDYAMQFVEASYRSAFTRMQPRPGY